MSREPSVMRVDWQLCKARGLCAELLPERIVLDEWGYPMVTGDIPADLLTDAKRAARSCPHAALHVVSER